MKKEERQETGFETIKEELKKQDSWIRHLHNYSRDLHKYTNYIDESNAKHKKEIVLEINKLNQGISNLFEAHNELKKEFVLLRKELESALRKDFEQYHKTFETYLNLKFEQNKIDKEEIKSKIIQEMKDCQGTGTKKYEESTPSYKENLELTNPERELLNLLFNENKPMTYEEMSAKMNKSLNSVRVYMNSLRSKKSVIEEFSTPNGIKVFSIKNSELVNTLFNLN